MVSTRPILTTLKPSQHYWLQISRAEFCRNRARTGENKDKKPQRSTRKVQLPVHRSKRNSCPPKTTQYKPACTESCQNRWRNGGNNGKKILLENGYTTEVSVPILWKLMPPQQHCIQTSCIQSFVEIRREMEGSKTKPIQHHKASTLYSAPNLNETHICSTLPNINPTYRILSKSGEKQWEYRQRILQGNTQSTPSTAPNLS